VRIIDALLKTSPCRIIVSSINPLKVKMPIIFELR